MDLGKQIDPYTDSMMTIDRLITMIFLGQMFNISAYFDLGAAESREFHIEVPDNGDGTNYHVWFRIHGSLNFNVELFEDTTKVADPANIIPTHNRNRMSDNTCTITITHTPTGSGDGTLIYTNQWGADAGVFGIGGAGGALAEANQWVLKPGANYLARVTSTQADNEIGVSADIVEFVPEDNAYYAKPYSNRTL